jgi:hypothetical protein
MLSSRRQEFCDENPCECYQRDSSDSRVCFGLASVPLSVGASHQHLQTRTVVAFFQDNIMPYPAAVWGS